MTIGEGFISKNEHGGTAVMTLVCIWGRDESHHRMARRGVRPKLE